jgi:hypothetical protein
VLLSLEVASAADPIGVSAGVVEVMAMLSPAAVRRDLLRSAGQAGTLLGGGRRVAVPLVDRALEGLTELPLLDGSLDGQAVSMHGLVARVVRGELARHGRLAGAWRAAAAVLESSGARPAQRRDHAAARDVLGQVTALLGHAGAVADHADDELASTLMRLRFFALSRLAELGDSVPDAIAIGEPLVADLERVRGSSHPDTLNARNSLARAYRDAGRVADAVPLLERTLAAREWLLGADDPGTLASRNNLATAYRATGRAAEAVPLFEKNVAACERLLGAGHPKTLASRRSLDLARRESG